MTLHTRFYKLNSNGKSVQVWEIHTAKDDKSYWTVSGQVDGKKIESAPTLVIPKVKRTQREQLLLEVEQLVTLKRRKKYVENLADIGEKADKDLPGYSAMLAHKWADQSDKIKFPCIVQPKLDGVRCLVTKDGMFSRGRKVIDSCEHVREALKGFFKEHPEAQLDGELYTHEYRDDFETILSAVRTQLKHASPEDLELQKKVQLHIYDAPRIMFLKEKDPFYTRFTAVTELLPKAPKSLRVVKTRVVKSDDELSEIHEEHLADGYEGTMVRNTDMIYKGSRSSELLKLKEHDDGEFEILGVNEGKGKLVGHAATFEMQMPDGATFKGKLKGEQGRLAAIWKNPSLVIGKMCTVNYYGLTNKEKVPRFPVVKSIRGDKGGGDWL